MRKSRSILLACYALLMTIFSVACDKSQAPKAPKAYLTEGKADIRTCTGVGIEKCNYEEIDIPLYIDLQNTYWAGVRSEQKSGGYFMCYRDLQGSLLSEKMLMFQCTPTEPRDETEQVIREYIFPLTEAAAILNICLNSKAYNDFSAKQSLKLHDLTMQLDDAVARIAQNYEIEGIDLVHGMMAVKMSSDPELKAYVAEKYNYCSDKLLTEMEQYMEGTDERISQFMTKQDQ